MKFPSVVCHSGSIPQIESFISPIVELNGIDRSVVEAGGDGGDSNNGAVNRRLLFGWDSLTTRGL